MIRPALAILFTLSCLAPASAETGSSLPPWPALEGSMQFVQHKTLQGLPRPLQSSGEIIISDQQLQWITTAPVQQKLLISRAGVNQWQQQEWVAVAGSKFVGQLLLAVLQQDQAFIQQHFSIKASGDNCYQLSPDMAPLTTLFRDIKLCGAAYLSRVQLTEQNGNLTAIQLQPLQETP